MRALAPTLQSFFTDYMQRQRKASPHTIAAYRDTIRLLLAFTAQRTDKQPHQLAIGDLDTQLIVAFLDHIEHERHNTSAPATRGSQRSTRSTTTPGCATPNTPP